MVSKNKILKLSAFSLAFALLFLLPLISAGVCPGGMTGSGTSASPCKIVNWTGLNAIRSNLTLTYNLTTNLNTSTADYTGLGDSWVPVGNTSKVFTGSLRGNKFTISNLTIPDNTLSDVGLFGTFTTGTISNLNLNVDSISGSSSTNIGGLVGNDRGTIINCSVTVYGSIDGGEYAFAGGLAGFQDVGSINNCSATIYGSINGYYTGGLLGDRIGGAPGIGVTNSSAIIKSGSLIHGSYVAGGLVGNNEGPYGGGIYGNSYVLVEDSANLTGDSGVGLLAFNGGGTFADTCYALIQDTIYGNITFLNWNVIGAGNILDYIQINNNSAYIDSVSQPGFNVAANVTLQGLKTNFANPKIFKDDAICTDCYNFTSLNAGIVKFNVSSWSNYSIEDLGCVGATKTFVCGDEVTESCTLNGDLIAANYQSVINVTGSLSPDATGIYVENGTYNGYPAYEREDSLVWIWAPIDGSTWIISDAPGNMITTLGEAGNWFGGSNVIGTYEGFINCIGTATAEWANISTSGICFNIATDNVTIDLTGFNITGNIDTSKSGDRAYTNLTLKNGIIFGNVLLIGADNEGGFGFDGGNVVITNSTITSISSIGGNGIYSYAGSSGTITVSDSTISTIIAIGGIGGDLGGNGGLVTITNSNIVTINTTGGTAPGGGGNGGTTIISNSNITTINAPGGPAEVGWGGNGGNVNITNSILNLSSISINIAGGSADVSGVSGTLILNQTSLYNSFGEIKFSYVSTQQTSFNSILSITNNSAYVNSGSYVDYNKSANITLLNLPTNFTNPVILKNGVQCPAGQCYNFTSLNAGNVTFNVTSWSNYSVGEGGDLISPNVTLSKPLNNYYNNTSSPINITFQCNVTDETNLKNISLYITNSTNSGFSLNQTAIITGLFNSTSWTLSLANGNYTWNCLAYDDAENPDWGDTNRSLIVNYVPISPNPVISDELSRTFVKLLIGFLSLIVFFAAIGFIFHIIGGNFTSISLETAMKFFVILIIATFMYVTLINYITSLL
jgi:hypothetical protein